MGLYQSPSSSLRGVTVSVGLPFRNQLVSDSTLATAASRGCPEFNDVLGLSGPAEQPQYRYLGQTPRAGGCAVAARECWPSSSIEYRHGADVLPFGTQTGLQVHPRGQSVGRRGWTSLADGYSRV